MDKSAIQTALGHYKENHYKANQFIAAAIYDFWKAKGHEITVHVATGYPHEIHSSLKGGLPK